MRVQRVKTGIPGLRIIRSGHMATVDYLWPADAQDGWDFARRLPALVREALAADRVHRARLRRIHAAYPARWRRR